MLTTPAVLDRMARALPGHPALSTEERTAVSDVIVRALDDIARILRARLAERAE